VCCFHSLSKVNLYAGKVIDPKVLIPILHLKAITALVVIVMDRDTHFVDFS
jgi:hypothetical protein